MSGVAGLSWNRGSGLRAGARADADDGWLSFSDRLSGPELPRGPRSRAGRAPARAGAPARAALPPDERRIVGTRSGPATPWTSSPVSLPAAGLPLRARMSGPSVMQ